MSCFVAFHYRSYGTFFLQQNRLHNIHRGFTHYKYYRAEISRPTLERLFSMRENYKVTGRHPGYRKYNGDGSVKEIEE